jgi:hypothetical protein
MLVRRHYEASSDGLARTITLATASACLRAFRAVLFFIF